MKQDWLDISLKLAARPADFYSGARKIIRGESFEFKRIKNDLTLADCGFTKSKQTMLVKNYLNEESRDAAVILWDRRCGQAKYGSIGFSTYNHYVKGGAFLTNPRKDSKPMRASVMGPCIQSVTLTLLTDKTTAVDVFYRTTELFKKFPADLVFIRDVLLQPFDLKKFPISEIRFHFANITCHPMYFVTLIPHIGLDELTSTLDRIKAKDKYFFDWVVKWTARYVCKEHHRGIQKFAQAMRVCQDAQSRIDAKKMKRLQQYLRDNHPGHRKEYEDPEDDSE